MAHILRYCLAIIHSYFQIAPFEHTHSYDTISRISSEKGKCVEEDNNASSVCCRRIDIPGEERWPTIDKCFDIDLHLALCVRLKKCYHRMCAL